MNQAWPTKRLADVCQILGGATPSKKNPKFYGGDIPWATVGDMNVEVITTTEEYITKAAVADCSTNIIPSGSIVMATRVGLGKVCVLGQDTAINQDLKGLTPKNTKELTTRWLFWWLKSKASDIQKAGTGATVQGVKMTFVQELEIPLPPLAEQKRIVALLDEAFAGIDVAKAKAEDNRLGAKQAFQSILETLLSPTAAGWTERKLDDLCVIKGRIGYRGYTKNDLVEKGHGAITLSPSNIKQNRFVADDCTYISWFKYDESPEIMVFDGDILFVKTGSTYGKVAIARDLPEKATINPQFVVLKEMKCNNWFLYYSMTTNSFKGGVEGIVGGAATPTISQANLGELTIHVPPIRTQETIVKQLDAAHEAATLLGDLYEKKIAALNELKSSLLSQAFAGELTA